MMKGHRPESLDLVSLVTDPVPVAQGPGSDDEPLLLGIEELEPRLAPDHLPGYDPPGRTVGWGC
jgi:hypothetical protein